MPQHASGDYVGGAVVKPGTDLSTSLDTSNSSTPASAPPASSTTTTSNDDRVADAAGDVDMETSMTTTADVQVHQPKQQRDSGPARHVRFDYCNSLALQCLSNMLPIFPANHNDNPLNCPLSKSTQVSRYQKKHSLTHVLSLWLLLLLINFLHFLRSMASSLHNCRV